MQVLKCDIHKTPFSDGSFDTIVDTFGLECCYDLDLAWAEMKRVTKPGGKILLLERGKAIWLKDNFEIMRKATLNLGARGQVYHTDWEKLIEADPDVKVLKCKRKLQGMLYVYIIEKL